MNLIGVDVGGTKCAVIYGSKIGDELIINEKIVTPTTTLGDTINNVICNIENIMVKNRLNSLNTDAIGISCGGPLDSEKGIVMSPPNLPGWDNVPFVDTLYKYFNIPTGIQNDANACALAEWKFGAGKGYKNVIFLTFGTGMGSGLILNGALYTGTNDNAGEVGHIRLSGFGPVGYGKIGSFEGFCSGGGIAQLAKIFIQEKLQMGEKVDWCKDIPLESITAKEVAVAARNGDLLAKDVYKFSAVKLGKALSLLIDILNPEVIAIGGIYGRCRDLMESYVLDAVKNEALYCAEKVCKIMPSGLGEAIGDYAALSVAANLIKDGSDE